MKKLLDHKVLLWDFDGVILDSMPIRAKGFEKVLTGYPVDQVEELMKFHNENGGLSRYVKFRHFYEVIRKESVTEEEVLRLASLFSEIMLENLAKRELLINDAVEFIEANYSSSVMHIVSGSDGNELRLICKLLQLSPYFLSIHGSPTPKKQLIQNLLQEYGYNKEDVVLIGDSWNDFDAAEFAGISFYGYNNPELKMKSGNYITSFADFKK